MIETHRLKKICHFFPNNFKFCTVKKNYPHFVFEEYKYTFQEKKISRHFNDSLEFFSDEFNIETSDESHKEASHDSDEKACNDEYHVWN